GRLHTGLAIGLWTAWCLFEVLERLGSKPYVKEGPWWQRNYRKASAMDLVSYVGFKNLVIGALLFLLLQSLDLLMLSAV
ncbi:MAG TPA: transcription regulator, partial [Candidatus Kapabacteria bacterium]|nr:transcription regulator [Candidatus Kapabacteria bacterium]